MQIRPLPPLGELSARYYVDPTSPTGLRHINGRPAGELRKRIKCGASSFRWALEISRRPRKRIFVHRIVFALHHGRDTDLQIDHIDGNPLNNRIENLRECTNKQNCQNSGANRRSSTKIRGVYPCDGKFQVKVMVHGRLKCFGRYETLEKAKEVRNRIGKEMHGEFYRLQ